MQYVCSRRENKEQVTARDFKKIFTACSIKNVPATIYPCKKNIQYNLNVILRLEHIFCKNLEYDPNRQLYVQS